MSDQLLTILFTDVEGSTELHAARGDGEARRILSACDEVVRRHVHDHDGREVKGTGDGLMVTFASPRQALTCALAIDAALCEGRNAMPEDAVGIRMGMHTGMAVEEGGDLFGAAVNAAARIAAKAQGDEVLVSEVVRQLCGIVPGVIFEERGSVKLRGFPQRWRLYRVRRSPLPNAAGGGEEADARQQPVPDEAANSPTAGASLRIDLTGRLQIEAAGTMLEGRGFAGRQVRLAFAYLVAHRRSPVPHDELAEVLWPGEPPAAWQRNVSVVATRVRAALADLGLGERVLTSSQGCFHLDLPRDTRVDVEEAAAAADGAEAALKAGDWPSAAADAHRAAELARRPFLPGDEGPWVDQMRSAQRSVLVRALDAGAQAALASGEGVRAVALAEEAVELDPFRETGCRQLIRALAAVGDRARALQVYERCRRLLADELGVSPAAETEAVYLEVLRADRPQPTSPDQSQRVPIAPRERSVAIDGGRDPLGLTPFVGRERERSELLGLLERAGGGHGALVMIGGEPGVGKSRLSEEIVAEAQQRGFRALTGHCYQTEGDLPYMPWVEIVEAAIREVTPEVLRQALGDSAPELARVAPQLRRVFPDIPPPLELPPEQQRRYMFNSILDYISRVAGIRPQLYVLEDLHWADRSTLGFLQHLTERLTTLPVLVIGTYRDPPIDISPAMAEALAELVRRRQARLLTLRRHSEGEVTELLHVLSGQSPPTDVSAAVYAETDGNAFFVEEVFRHLSETGRLLDEHGNFHTHLRIDELDVPENVRLVTAHRLARLREATRQTLSVAAIIGRRFSVDLLGVAAEVHGDDLTAALDEAERAQLIMSDPAVHETYYLFAHELVRQALLTQLSALRRQEHHLRVANALERVHAGEVEQRATEIAHHLVESRESADRPRTAHYLTLAGDRAMAGAAFEEALRDYGRGLEVLPTHEMRRRAELLIGIGMAQRSLCRWEATERSFEEALGLLEACGDLDAVVGLCWQCAVQFGWAYRFHELLAVTHRGLTALGDSQGAHGVRLLAMKLVGLTMGGDLAQAGCLAEEVKARAEELDDPRLLGDVAPSLICYHEALMHFGEVTAEWRRLEAPVRASPDVWQLAQTLCFLDMAYVFTGRFDESDRVHRELGPLAERVGHWAVASFLRRNEFTKSVARGESLSSLAEMSATQFRVAEGMGSSAWQAHAHTLRGIVEFWRGDWTAARVSMEEGARLALPGFWFGPHHGFLFLLLAMSGQREAAYAVLGMVEDALPTPGTVNMLGSWNLGVLVAEGIGILGDAERARRIYPVVVEALATGTVMRQYDGALLQASAGIVAATAGLMEWAEEHFETALQQAEELPHLMERPHVRHLYGRFLMTRGGQEGHARAAQLLSEAAAGYRAIGMPRHEALVERDLARLTKAVGPRRRRTEGSL